MKREILDHLPEEAHEQSEEEEDLAGDAVMDNDDLVGGH